MPLAPHLPRASLAGLLFCAFRVVVLSLLAACGAPSLPKAAAESVNPGKGETVAVASSTTSEPASETDLVIPISADDAVRGSRLAFVTVVVFTDFQCPFCGRLVPTLDRVQEVYGDDVRIVLKNEPLSFHPHARLAAEVGAAVFALKGADAFWRYHDMAFRRQQRIAPDAIRAWAIEAGADSRDVEEGLTSKKWGLKVERDEALAKRLGVSGTPASFVNGTLISGAQPFDKFKESIDAALREAKEAANRGTPRDRVYGQMVAANFKEPKDDADDPPDTAVWKVPVAGSPVRGPSTALVTIVEFGDFQCPYCKKVQPALERLRTEYGDRLRFVWKDEPLSFHSRALPAAQLARFARAQKGDAGFWAMHDRLFATQPKLEDADLESAARDAGLDAKSAMAAVKSQSFAHAIDDDVGLADDVSATGTPHFFINGKRLVGAESFDKFKAVVDSELVNAEALMRGGKQGPVKPAAVYETIIKDGKSASEPERRAVAPSTVPAPFRGSANAKVVIQEFSDFQCPFCSRAEPTIDQLLKDYPGKVKVVWRNMPLAFHADAQLAAEAAREAFVQKGNEGFSKMRELLFKHQSDADGLKRPALEGYAGQIGLDLGKFGSALDAGTHKAAIEADRKAAADAGLSGTPAFTVGPFLVSGAQPLVRFKKLINRTLGEPMGPPAAAFPPGLVVKDLAVGRGDGVKSGDTVTVHYVGTLRDGSEFDSSRKRNQPLSFTIGRGNVIKGWESGLIGMKVGGRRTLTIPPDLGYGDRPPGSIPARSTLLFDIELLSIK